MERKERHLFIYLQEKKRNLDGRGNKQRLVGANGFAYSFLSSKNNLTSLHYYTTANLPLLFFTLLFFFLSSSN